MSIDDVLKEESFENGLVICSSCGLLHRRSNVKKIVRDINENFDYECRRCFARLHPEYDFDRFNEHWYKSFF